ncbi:unnamed protein product [Paramecium sonneborni]|uniref:Uncharacterized protein n=1 Tax=Paramecium sonneborni TaxID=65129 RepID=A0A8S1QXD5_9CILI|nr:unnamed protein product [Paramecium sonneborni]
MANQKNSFFYPVTQQILKNIQKRIFLIYFQIKERRECARKIIKLNKVIKQIKTKVISMTYIKRQNKVVNKCKRKSERNLKIQAYYNHYFKLCVYLYIQKKLSFSILDQYLTN